MLMRRGRRAGYGRLGSLRISDVRVRAEVAEYLFIGRPRQQLEDQVDRRDIYCDLVSAPPLERFGRDLRTTVNGLIGSSPVLRCTLCPVNPAASISNIASLLRPSSSSSSPSKLSLPSRFSSALRHAASSPPLSLLPRLEEPDECALRLRREEFGRLAVDPLDSVRGPDVLFHDLFSDSLPLAIPDTSPSSDDDSRDRLGPTRPAGRGAAGIAACFRCNI